MDPDFRPGPAATPFVAGSPPPPTSLPAQVSESIGRFAGRAHRMAMEIIPEERVHIPRDGVIIIRERWSPGPFFWWYPQPVYVGGRSSARDDRNAIGVLAVAGAVFLSFAIGRACVRVSDAGRQLNEARNFSDSVYVAQGPLSPADQNRLEDAREVASLSERISKRIKNSAAVDLALRISLFVGLTFVAIGAFASCPPMFGIGLITVAVLGCAILFKAGIESFDRRNLMLAYDLKDRAQRLGG